MAATYEALFERSSTLSALIDSISETYGTSVAIHEKKQGFYQHISYGRLREECEALCLELARLFDGVGKDLDEGVLAALQPVGAEDNGGAFSDSVRTFELGDTVVAVFFGCLCFCHIFIFPFRIQNFGIISILLYLMNGRNKFI